MWKSFTGGSEHRHSRAVVEPLCLPRDPQWGNYKDGTDSPRQSIYGAEYQTYSQDFMFRKKIHDHDVPCAVCHVKGKSAIQVIPARKNCYEGWSKEYSGYLMSGHYSHKAASTFTCVDKNPDTVHGGHDNKDGYLFYFVEARCGSFTCPPYVNGRELTCVVCSATLMFLFNCASTGIEFLLWTMSIFTVVLFNTGDCDDQ